MRFIVSIADKAGKVSEKVIDELHLGKIWSSVKNISRL